MSSNDRPIHAGAYKQVLGIWHISCFLEIAQINPLSKTTQPKSPNNTRPVALLPKLSKITERVVQQQLLEFIKSHNLLGAQQSCYKQGHSTQTALLGVLDDVKFAIEHRKLTILVLFDFSKAFGCIPHKALLIKLQKMGISRLSLAWFFNYLQGRQQAVRIDRARHSGYRPIASGVPQGSVLEPLLFGLYSSDLPTVLVHCKCRKYALVKRDSQAVSNWAVANGLEVNETKTQVIILGSLPYVSAIDLANLRKIRINNTPLKYATEVKNLGVIINQTIDWNLHEGKVQSKVYSYLAILRLHRRSLSFTLKTQLIKSLVIPHFDYTSVIYMHVDKTRGNYLQIAHNACIRFIHGYVSFIPTNDINIHLTHLAAEAGLAFTS